MYRTMNGKNIKPFLPVTNVSGIFIGSQKNWATLTEEAYAMYMTFMKFSYYLYDTKVTIKCNHAPLQKVLIAYTFNSKMNNQGT